MTPTAVEEKYAVTPEHYPDIAALVGETSDNLPGVPGVGPKTAAKWINQYGTLDALVADVDNIPGKAGESLREHLDDVLRNRRINALIRDLDLPAGPADLELRHGVGPRGDPHRLRRTRVQRAARPAVRGIRRGRAADRGGVRPRWRQHRARCGRSLARRALDAGRTPRSSRAGLVGSRHGRCGGAGRSPRTMRPRGSTSTRSRPTTTPRSPPGSPIRSVPRCCTTSRVRPWRLPPAAGRSRASPPTRRCRPTSYDPISVPTISPIFRCATSSASCATTPRRRAS